VSVPVRDVTPGSETLRERERSWTLSWLIAGRPRLRDALDEYVPPVRVSVERLLNEALDRLRSGEVMDGVVRPRSASAARERLRPPDSAAGVSPLADRLRVYSLCSARAGSTLGTVWTIRSL